MSLKSTRLLYPAIASVASIVLFFAVRSSLARNSSGLLRGASQQVTQPANARTQGAQAGPGRFPGRGPGRGFGPPSLKFNFNDHAGFTRIFDGKDLQGWDGAPQVWHVEDGAIVGRSTTASPSGTTFVIYRGSSPANFDMKLEIKMTGQGNSGIQYRSRQALPDPNFFLGRGRGPGRGPGGQGGRRGPVRGGRGGRGGFNPKVMNRYVKWNMQGYQFDDDPSGGTSGDLWEGGRFKGERDTVTTIGQIVELEPSNHNILLGTVAPRATVLSWWHTNGWNQEEIVARGNVLTHLINGHIISESIDDNVAKRVTHGGLIGIQIESGGNFTVWARDIWLKVIPD